MGDHARFGEAGFGQADDEFFAAQPRREPRLWGSMS